MEASVILLCVKFAGSLGALGVGLLLVTAAVNCRAEDEYWDRFWTETPTACLGSSGSAQVEGVEIPFELRLAA